MMMLGGACVGAWHDVIQIALRLHAYRQDDQKQHEPDDGK